MIKSKRPAYDGRGNVVAKSEHEISAAASALGGYERGLYVEKWAPFVKELAIIVARGKDDSIVCYPVVETIHKENICHIVKAPAIVPWKVKKLATDVAYRAVSSLQGAGVFAVELFLTEDGQVLLNDVAPRPHNSGHHTIESCYTSQYEQHLRAVLGLPLGNPAMKTPAAIMYNILGEDEVSIVSAHRTPDKMFSYAKEAHLRGVQVIITGAGGAAHLPGMVAAMTPLPVIGVPVRGSSLDGLDSLLSIVQMPRGVPVATVAINNATNAG